MDQTDTAGKGLNWALNLSPWKPQDACSSLWPFLRLLVFLWQETSQNSSGILGSPFPFSLLIHRTISSGADKDKDVSVREKWSIMGKRGKMLSGQQLTLRSHWESAEVAWCGVTGAPGPTGGIPIWWRMQGGQILPRDSHSWTVWRRKRRTPGRVAIHTKRHVGTNKLQA